MSMIGNFLQLAPSQLQRMVDDPSLVESFIYPDEDRHPDCLDIDKAWHGIHFLLTGDPWAGQPPLCNVILGGTEIGDDFGYGPPRFLTAEEVGAVAEALNELPWEKLALRFDAGAMNQNDIYPQIWDEGNQTLDYLKSSYEALSEFYRAALNRGNAMLKFLD